MSIWVYEYMSIWVYEYMSIWVYEYISIWVSTKFSTYSLTHIHMYIQTWIEIFNANTRSLLFHALLRLSCCFSMCDIYLMGSMSKCMYACMYMHVYVCACRYMYVYIRMCAYMYVGMYVCMRELTPSGIKSSYVVLNAHPLLILPILSSDRASQVYWLYACSCIWTSVYMYAWII